MTNKLNALLLDNSEMITYRMEFMLLNNKNIQEVETAHTIAWAEDILKRRKTDVVILDIKFSDGNGIDFLKRLKITFPKLNIVILTNHADDWHRNYTKKLGADYFIDKSMAFQEVTKVLAQIASATSINQ